MTKAERESLIEYHLEQARDYERQLARTGNGSLRSYVTHHRQETRRLREWNE